jgi:hypothetical protein
MAVFSRRDICGLVNGNACELSARESAVLLPAREFLEAEEGSTKPQTLTPKLNPKTNTLKPK